MPENVRLEAYFSGHVQGVGFRFTTLDVADRFPAIVGFVRNLADGRVQVVAEGAADEVDAFVAAVGEAMRAHIHGVSTHRLPATGEFARFAVAR